MTTDIHNYERSKIAAIRNIDRTKITPKNKELLKKFLDQYSIDHSLTQARIYKYVTTLRNCLLILDKDINLLTEDDIRGFIAKIKARDMSEVSRKDFCVMLRVMLKWYARYDKHTTKEFNESLEYFNGFSYKVDENKVPEHEILTEDDIKKLVKVAKTQRDKALVMTLWDSGARIGEILTLRNKDVKAFEYGYRLSIQVSKTQKRTLPLVECSPYLRDYINNENQYYEDEPNRLFWVDNRGNGLTYPSLRAMLRRLLYRTSIKKRLNPHIFRHSRATDLANKGWREAQMSSFFGWKMGSSMPSIYIRKSGVELESAMLESLGLQKKEDSEEKGGLKPLNCVFCKHINPATNTYCAKCQKPLRTEDIQKAEQERESYLKTLKDSWMQKELDSMKNNTELLNRFADLVIERIENERRTTNKKAR